MPQRKQLTALQKKALAEKRKAQRAAESDEVRRRRLENDAARRRRRQQTKERGPHDVEPTVKLPLEEPQVLTVLPMPEFLLKQELNEHQGKTVTTWLMRNNIIYLRGSQQGRYLKYQN